MIDIQRLLAERALELLNLPPNEPSFIADLGCGSGLSGEVLSGAGHHWLGFDISAAMLDVATQEETDGDLCLLDLGQGLPVRNAIFDGAIRFAVFSSLSFFFLWLWWDEFDMRRKAISLSHDEICKYVFSKLIDNSSCLFRVSRAVFSDSFFLTPRDPFV
jgi:SAM-dependent methyltransferase